MTTDQQAVLERFCREWTAFDSWQWRETCAEILAETDYSAPATATVNGQYYTVKVRLLDGRALEVGRRDGGFYARWGK